MGQDIHICLGRVKPLAIGMTRSKTPIALLGDTSTVVHYSQLEFVKYCQVEEKGRKVNRNYDLFSFLFNSCRGDIAPLLQDISKLMDVTEKFTKWVDIEYCRHKELTDSTWNPRYSYDWNDTFIGGDHSQVVYPTTILAGFNYSQQVIVSQRDEFHTTEQHERKVAKYANTTYLELFGQDWINFLNWCLEENWSFLVLSLDN